MVKSKNTVKLQKIGNSYMLTMTKDIIKKTKLKVGDVVNIKVQDDNILITKNKSNREIQKYVGIFNVPQKITNKKILKMIKETQYDERIGDLYRK